VISATKRTAQSILSFALHGTSFDHPLAQPAGPLRAAPRGVRDARGGRGGGGGGGVRAWPRGAGRAGLALPLSRGRFGGCRVGGSGGICRLDRPPRAGARGPALRTMSSVPARAEPGVPAGGAAGPHSSRRTRVPPVRAGAVSDPALRRAG